MQNIDLPEWMWTDDKIGTIAVFTHLCTAREITSQESVNARVRVHTINIGTKKLEFLSTDDVNSGMSTESIAWPQVVRRMKIGSECKQTNMMARFFISFHFIFHFLLFRKSLKDKKKKLKKKHRKEYIKITYFHCQQQAYTQRYNK